jgi:hypothetical protein
MARGLHAILLSIGVIVGSIANSDLLCPKELERVLENRLKYNANSTMKTFEISQSILKKIFELLSMTSGLLNSWNKVVTSETVANNENKSTKSEDKKFKSI